MRNTYASNDALEVGIAHPHLEIKASGDAPVYPDTPIRLALKPAIPAKSRLALDSETRLIGASVVARQLGVPVQTIVADIESGLAGRNAFAFSGAKFHLGWFVEAWEMEGDRPAYHAKRLAGGSSAALSRGEP